MSDTTAQMLPEAFHRIQLGRVGGQADQLDPILCQPGRSSALWLGNEALQSCPVEGMDRISHHIFTVEDQTSNLHNAVVLRRQQDDLAVRFQYRICRPM